VTATVLSVTGTIMAAVSTSTVGATITRAAVTADAGAVVSASASSTLLFSSTSTVSNGVTSTISNISATGSPQIDFAAQNFATGTVYTIATSGVSANNITVTILAVSQYNLVVAQQLTDTATPSATATLTRAATSKVSEGVSIWNVTNATCPASSPAGALACYVTGNSAANFLDFNWCTGTLTCGGSGTLVVNIPTPDTVVGGAVCK
jgi:hypothetical protein